MPTEKESIKPFNLTPISSPQSKKNKPEKIECIRNITN